MSAKTLYELLKVRPNDDGEALQIAFRNAAKANHPDLNPGDPDASRRFRQIVTAYEILRDTARRRAYDRLLAFARAQRRAELTRRIVSGATGVAVALTIVLVVGYPSKTSVEATKVVEVAAREPTDMTAVEPTTGVETTNRDQPSERLQKIPEISATPSAVTSTMNRGDLPAITNVVEPASSSDVSDRGPLSGKSAPGERADVPIVPNAEAPVARSGEPSIVDNGGLASGPTRSNSEVAKAGVTLDAKVGRGDARNGADDRGKNDASNPTHQDRIRSGEPQLSLSEKDTGTAKSPPPNSAIADAKRQLRTTGKPRVQATRTATSRLPVGQFILEIGDVAQIVIDGRGVVGCAGSCSSRAPILFGLGF